MRRLFNPHILEQSHMCCRKPLPFFREAGLNCLHILVQPRGRGGDGLRGTEIVQSGAEIRLGQHR